MSQTLRQRLALTRASALMRKAARRVYCEPKLEGNPHEFTHLRDLQAAPSESLWPFAITVVLAWCCALAAYFVARLS